MAKLRILAQALTATNHADELRSMFTKKLTGVLIGVAFARTQGVNVVLATLTQNAANARVFVGIRNGVSSYQALEMLLQTGAALYTVDTGAVTTIFHPKVYVAASATDADVVIGSANLTFGGLHNNIEFSTALNLNLQDVDDRKSLDEIVGTFDNLIKDHPKHVVRIKNTAQIQKLLDQGLIVDETVVRESTQLGSTKNEDTDQLRRMQLHFTTPDATTKQKKGSKYTDVVSGAANGAKKAASLPMVSTPPKSAFYTVWQSGQLKERHLSIPTGENTHATGSMLWAKGAKEGIDQRHYFRDEVFADSIWTVDTKRPHLERAMVPFHIYTKGKYHGKFTLKLSHNTDTTSKSYLQSNSMTSVSWGDAKDVIGRKALLGRVMVLSRRDTTPPEFMIQID